MSYREWDPAFGSVCEPDCATCFPDPEEHTDRQARYAEQDTDNAVIDAAMGENE